MSAEILNVVISDKTRWKIESVIKTNDRKDIEKFISEMMDFWAHGGKND